MACHSALLNFTVGMVGSMLVLKESMSGKWTGFFKLFVSYLHKVGFIRRWIACSEFLQEGLSSSSDPGMDVSGCEHKSISLCW